MDIKGKKAIIFGGTSGIGLATCQELRKVTAPMLSRSAAIPQSRHLD